jgi:pyruvate,water dikinase
VGLGSAVVGGEVTPDRWVIGKITGEISVREISDKMIQHVPAPAGGIDTIPVAGELRQAACMSDEDCSR